MERKGKQENACIDNAINTLFITMNVFDLLHFFPDPAQPMPFLVILIEVVDSIVAFTIILYAQQIVKSH